MAEAESRPLFTDEHERTLDSGLRVILSKDWRSLKITEFLLLPDSSSSFVKAFPRLEFDKWVAKIEDNTSLDEKTRNRHLEAIASKSKKVQLDSAGRLAMPAALCAKIGVGLEYPNVILRGAARTFNIWNPERLKAYEEAQQKMNDAGAGSLSVEEFLGI